MEKVQKYFPLAGRVLLMVIFVVAGFQKLVNPDAARGYMAAHHIPYLLQALVGAIVVEIGGGLMIVAGYQVLWVSLGLLLYMIPVTLFFHIDFSIPVNSIMFMKNLAIMGGLLYVAAYGPGPISVDGWLSRKNMIEDE